MNAATPLHELGDRVSTHMTSAFPSTPDTGGWTVARDQQDGTAVVVWVKGMEPVQPQVRGMVLYRWLRSLRAAGFDAQARTDMAVFGRPDEESPDRIARWLHVTGWSEPAARTAAPLPPLPAKPAQRTVPMPRGRSLVCPLSGVPVSEVLFTYRVDGSVEIVLHYESGEWDWASIETQPAAWLVELAEQHRPKGGA